MTDDYYMNSDVPIKESREVQRINFMSHLWNKSVNEPDKLTKAGSTEILRFVKLYGFDRIRPAKTKRYS